MLNNAMILDESGNNILNVHNNNINNNNGITANQNEFILKDIFGKIEKNILNKLEKKQIDDINKIPDENKKCYICLEDYINGDTVIFLPCFHFFHKNCILNWFEIKAFCPLCKMDINEFGFN